ncbi:16505_t:CDS:2 [Dentiscutata heterogama]|uniref:16505_t:CDS:1 n=1 Tax=Dentiscutata heterogama TaxID=1316150 RepID=A0ACA9JXS6_9GLOM|nr:16505_t:CDS:2 [Dentiscutata heterogama]
MINLKKTALNKKRFCLQCGKPYPKHHPGWLSGLNLNSVSGNLSCTLKKEESTPVSCDNNINTPTTVAPSHLTRKARDTPPKSKKKPCDGAQCGEQKTIPYDTKLAKRHTLVASLANAQDNVQRDE